MYLVRIIYTSKVSGKFSPDDIEQILVAARKNNAAADVTGLLCFTSNYFLQCLEGSRAAVNEIYRSILNDPRHESVELLDYAEIDERDFGQWDMAYVPDMHITKALNIKYSGTSHFQPFEMSGESAHKMMRALATKIHTE